MTMTTRKSLPLIALAATILAGVPAFADTGDVSATLLASGPTGLVTGSSGPQVVVGASSGSTDPREALRSSNDLALLNSLIDASTGGDRADAASNTRGRAPASTSTLSQAGRAFLQNEDGNVKQPKADAAKDSPTKPTPEPATLVLMALGGLGLLLRRRRK